MKPKTYTAKFPITNMNMTTSMLFADVRLQLTEQLVKKGLVPAGEMHRPEVFERTNRKGDPVIWLRVTIPVVGVDEVTEDLQSGTQGPAQ